MDNDSNGLETLTSDECLALARTVPIGRIVFTDQAMPAVQPVNFVFDDGSVIIRTAEGAKLAVATRQAIVAFEVDEFDVEAKAGWSVTIVGRAESVRDPADSARLARLPLHTWGQGRRPRFIRIHPDRITGRLLDGRSHRDGDHQIP